ncbi:hypothetical protein P278_28090 [Zhouia amylolytica AD3]|uniref:Uncharacterized protein n=1 Tax=Zhouia amylolytica AD3 TaxID=1286632 RepID=W2UIK1_9FLAO|nr:hypothetical protein P278_28090 [Zhouia amylolytica AD3]
MNTLKFVPYKDYETQYSTTSILKAVFPLFKSRKKKRKWFTNR